MDASSEQDRKLSSTTSFPPVTEAQRELANQAQLEFECKNYSSCIWFLNKLLSLRDDDTHVMHNLALAEFYQSDCKKVDNIRRSFSNIFQLCRTQPENAKNLEDVDQAMVYYNHALILYHMRRFSAALVVMDELFQIIDSLDEELAKKIMFLLIELYISTQQAEKSMGLLSYVERSLQGHTDSTDKPDPENKDVNFSVIWKMQLSQYKMRCYLMMKSFKFCKREMKLLNNLSSASSNQLFGYLKSNFEYLRGNYRKAMKILVSTAQTPPLTDNGQSLPVMFYNNLACIHFALGKYNLATFYQRKAITENKKLVADIGKQPYLHCMGSNHYYPLVYNLGVQLLHCKQPQLAFDCLILCLAHFSNNPRLWLRMAECCIAFHHQANETFTTVEARQHIVQCSLGSGVHRKLILSSSDQPRIITDSPAMPALTLEFASLCIKNALALIPDSSPNSSTSPDDWLMKGESMVRAAPSNPLRATDIPNLRSSILCAGAYVALSLQDHYIALSYCAKLISQPNLSPAHRYLVRTYQAEAYLLADRMSDAIDQLDPTSVVDVSVTAPQQKQEAEKQDGRSEKDTTENSGAESSGMNPCQQWYPSDLIQGRAVMYYNQAVCYAHRGDLQKSAASMTKSISLFGDAVPSHMILLQLYLNLIKGQKSSAQAIFKQYYGHKVANTGLIA